MQKLPFDRAERSDHKAAPITCSGYERAISVNRQWANFLQSLSTGALPEADPLLSKAMEFHPRFHMYLSKEDDRLALLQRQCLRLCAGDETRSKRLAADVIWAGMP